jgi:hypothetical protein
MAYCKHCGMESSNASKCEWCGRQLTGPGPVPQSGPLAGDNSPQAVPPAAPPIAVNSPQSRLEKMDEDARQGRTRFFIGLAILVVVAVVSILVRYQLYPWIILAATFTTGYLLRRFDVIESYSGELMMVALIVLVPVPVFFMLLGLVGYGVIQKDPNYAFIWLMGAYLAVEAVLVPVTLIAMPRMVPAAMFMPLFGLEKLGFIAAVLGWRAGGTYS